MTILRYSIFISQNIRQYGNYGDIKPFFSSPDKTNRRYFSETSTLHSIKYVYRFKNYVDF